MDLQQKVDSYQADESVRCLIMDTKIVLLVGISGAGKDTVKQLLLEQNDFADIVSYTTRAPRQNIGEWEQEGVDYYFIDQKQAEEMLDEHLFVEAKFVHGTLYGTGIEQIKYIHDSGKIAITDIDVQGVDEYKKLSPGVVAVFLLPPSYDEWRRRLSLRYTDAAEFEQAWPKRFESAVQELAHALETPYYHFIVNDKIDEAVRIVREIATRPDTYNRKDDEARLAARDLLEQLLTAS